MPDEGFKPLRPDEWPSSLDALKDGFASRLNVYRTMANHPELLLGWSGLRDHIVVNNELGPVLTEVVILRASRHLGSSYERAHHIVRARACGMSDNRIAAILDGSVPDKPADAILAHAVDDLCTQNRIAPEMLSRLVESIGRKGVLDLIAITGFYTTLGYILNSFGTPLDEDIATELANNPLPD